MPSSKWPTRSRTAPAEGIRPAPLFSVLVGYETLHGRICELENGTVLHPSALEPWMDSAYFERAIFSLPNRIDVSAAPGSSPEAPDGPSSCATACAPTRTATSPPRPARSTTSRPTPQGARPPRTTAACSVASTTAYATSESTQGEQRQRPAPERRLTGRPAVSGPARPGLHPGRCHGRHFEKRSTPALWRARVSACADCGRPTRPSVARTPQDKCVCGRSSSTPSRNKSIFSL